MAEQLWNMLKLLPSISASRKNSLITGLARIDEKTDELILSLYHLPEPTEFLGGKNATYVAWFFEEEGKHWTKIGELQRKNGLTFGYKKKVVLTGDGLFITVEEKGRDVKQPGIVILASNPEIFYSELGREELVMKRSEESSKLEVQKPEFVEVKSAPRMGESILPIEKEPVPVEEWRSPEIPAGPEARNEHLTIESIRASVPFDEPASMVSPTHREIPLAETLNERTMANNPNGDRDEEVSEKAGLEQPSRMVNASEENEVPATEWQDPRMEMWKEEAEVPASEPVYAAPPQPTRPAVKPSAPRPKKGHEPSEDLKKLLSDFYADLPGDELMGMIKDRYNALKKEIDLRMYWEKCKKYLQNFWEETKLSELWEAIKRDLKYLIDRIGLNRLWEKIEELIMELIEFLDPRQWMAKAKNLTHVVDEHLHDWYETGKKYVNAILTEVEPATLWERIKMWIDHLLDRMNMDEIIVWIQVKIRELRHMRMEDVKNELERLFREFVDAVKLPELKMAVIKVAIRDKLGQVGSFFQKVKDTAIGQRPSQDPNRPGKMSSPAFALQQCTDHEVRSNISNPASEGFAPECNPWARMYGVPDEVSGYPFGMMNRSLGTYPAMGMAKTSLSGVATPYAMGNIPYTAMGSAYGMGNFPYMMMGGSYPHLNPPYTPMENSYAMGNTAYRTGGYSYAMGNTPYSATGNSAVMGNAPYSTEANLGVMGNTPYSVAENMTVMGNASYSAVENLTAMGNASYSTMTNPHVVENVPYNASQYSYAQGNPFYSISSLESFYPHGNTGDHNLTDSFALTNGTAPYAAAMPGTPGANDDPAPAQDRWMYENPHIFRATIDSPTEVAGPMDSLEYPMMMHPAAMGCLYAPSVSPCCQCQYRLQIQSDAMGDPRYVYHPGENEFFFITPDGEMISRS